MTGCSDAKAIRPIRVRPAPSGRPRPRRMATVLGVSPPAQVLGPISARLSTTSASRPASAITWPARRPAGPAPTIRCSTVSMPRPRGCGRRLGRAAQRSGCGPARSVGATSAPCDRGRRPHGRPGAPASAEGGRSGRGAPVRRRSRRKCAPASPPARWRRRPHCNTGPSAAASAALSSPSDSQWRRTCTISSPGSVWGPVWWLTSQSPSS